MKPLSSDQKFQTLKPKLVALGLLTLGATVVAIFSAATARGQGTRLFCSQARFEAGRCSQVGTMYNGSLTTSAEQRPQVTTAAASSGSSGSSPTTNDCTNIPGDNPRCFRVMNEQNGLELGAGTGTGTSGTGNTGLAVGYRRDTLRTNLRVGAQLGLGEDRGIPVAAQGNLRVHLGTPGSQAPHGTLGGLVDVNAGGDLVAPNGQDNRFEGVARAGLGLTFFTAEQIQRANSGAPQNADQLRSDRVFGRQYLRGFFGVVAGVGLRSGASLDAMNTLNGRIGGCLGADAILTSAVVLRARALACLEQVVRRSDGNNFWEASLSAEVTAALSDPSFQRWFAWGRVDVATAPGVNEDQTRGAVTGGIGFTFGDRTPTLIRPRVEDGASGGSSPAQIVAGSPIDSARPTDGTANLE